MVARSRSVAIDSSFLFERACSRFLGASLIIKDGQDNTLVYGFLRAFLMLWQKLDRCAVILLVTQDTHDAATSDCIDSVSAAVKALGIPVYARTDKELLQVCVGMSSSIGAVVSERNDLLQFVCEDFQVVRPCCDRNDLTRLDGDAVRDEFGIAPDDIPTFLALTTGSKRSRLTKKQARRLIAQYGGIHQIYQDTLKESKLGIKLNTFKDEILDRYCAHAVGGGPQHSRITHIEGARKLNLNSPANVEILREMGLYSLARLLREDEP